MLTKGYQISIFAIMQNKINKMYFIVEIRRQDAKLIEGFIFDNSIQNIAVMGCQNSNIVEIIPVDHQQIHQNHEKNVQMDSKLSPTCFPADKDLPANGKNISVVDKQNHICSEISIKLNLQNKQIGKVQCEGVTKRKARSQYRVNEEIMNDKTNIHQAKQERKKTVIIIERSKVFSVKQIKEKTVKLEIVGPSTHSILEQKFDQKFDKQLHSQKNNNKIFQDLTIPIVIEKQSVPAFQFISEDPQVQSQQIQSEHTVKSFKFEIYVESQAEILSKTQRMNHNLEIFVEKDEVTRYINMIEYGQKQEILGKLYEELEKKQEWNQVLSQSNHSCEPMVIIVTQKDEIAQNS